MYASRTLLLSAVVILCSTKRDLAQTVSANVIDSTPSALFSINYTQTTTDGGTLSPGFQLDTTSQTIGGTFGAGGGIAFQGNSTTDSDTGGFIFLGGSARGDLRKSQTLISGNTGTGVPTGIQIDGLDHGSGIANNVGIGLASGTYPGAKLEVNGNLKLTSSSGASMVYADGTIQSTAWTGTLCGGDYAESVDISGDRTHYEPGDLLVIDASAPDKFLKSIEPYSKLVSGIYSTNPGVIGRHQIGDPKTSTTEIAMAMVGIVPTKLSAENGPIKIGDLLVTSSTPGYAMKGTDPNQMLGAVVGKALGSLDSGTGIIEVLVTLQ